MVLGLGKAGLLPERRTPNKAGALRAGSGASQLGASSSSPRISVGGDAEYNPRAGQPGGLELGGAVGQPSPLLVPILQASLEHLSQQQQLPPPQQQQQPLLPPQQATRSGSSYVANSGAAGAAAPVSPAELVGPTPPVTCEAPSPGSLGGPGGAAEPSTGQHPSLREASSGGGSGGGRVGQQAALRRKLRAVANARLTLSVSEQQQAVGAGSPQHVRLGSLHVAQAPPAQQPAETGQAELQGLVGLSPAEVALPPVLDQQQPQAAPPVGQQQQQAQQGAGEGQRAKRARLSGTGTGARRGGQRGGAAENGGSPTGAATPTARRGGRGKKRGRGGGMTALTPSKAELIGKLVEVPASLFSVDVPGLYYCGVVTKREGGRSQDAMEVKFLDDGSKYWFPTSNIREWLAEMEARGAEAKDPGAGISVGKATDEFAAEVLTDIASGGSLRSGRGGSQVSDAAAGAPLGSQAGRQLASVQEEGEQAQQGCPQAAARGHADWPVGSQGPVSDEAEAVSSKRRRQAAAEVAEGGLRREGQQGGERMEEKGAGGSGGGHAVELKARGSSGLAAALHLMADAAGMNNLLSPPRPGSPEEA